MISYETWKSQLSSFVEEERADFEQVNESFRSLFGAEAAEADTLQDFNFVVDSLEDEHVRRAVHTTKTLEEIESENAEENGNSKAN